MRDTNIWRVGCLRKIQNEKMKAPAKLEVGRHQGFTGLMYINDSKNKRIDYSYKYY